MTECVAILSRVANNLENESFAFCRQVLLEGAKHEQPKPDRRYDDQFDSPGYSPFPRHEAASGLLRLAFHQSDGEILDAIEVLTGDDVPSVSDGSSDGIIPGLQQSTGKILAYHGQ